MDEKLLEKIFENIKRDPKKCEGYEDLLAFCKLSAKEEFKSAHEMNFQLREMMLSAMKDTYDPQRLYELYKESLRFDAPFFFEPYMLFMEIDRKPEERFYQPRMAVLRPVVFALQSLVDDELDELFLSLPPRTGKTTLMTFFITWLIGRDSERSNLYSAYSHVITNSMFNGVNEIIKDDITYKWKEVFPASKLVSTNAQEGTINIDRRKRYPSLTCRSLYGTLNGACDADGVVISDDLIGGIEEALNRDRLESAWSKVDNNLLTRAKASAKILWIGTRWSVIDPAGKRIELLENDPRFEGRRYKVISLPALNDKDESNFDYKFGVGFTTEYFHQRRASFERNNDMASWDAQYQQQPVEREGTLFDRDGFRYYTGTLPEEEPDRIFMGVDPAWGGGDYVAGAVCFQYGNDVYVHDVIYNNGDKRVTIPLIVDAVMKYKIKAVTIEASKTTASFRDEVVKAIRKKCDSMGEDYPRTVITTKPAPTHTGKEQRIFDNAPDIREFMIFRDSGYRSREYEAFMNNVYAFKMFGKNVHDDAPDCLVISIGMMMSSMKKVKVFNRPF